MATTWHDIPRSAANIPLRLRPKTYKWPRSAVSAHNVNSYAVTHGDAANVVFAGAGYNFRRLLERLALLLSAVLPALNAATSQDQPLKPA